MTTEIKQMKWHGWGDPKKNFETKDKPNLWPFIEKVAGVNREKLNFTPPIKFENIELPSPIIQEPFWSKIKEKLSEDQYETSKKSRLIHTYGKSFRDLWRIRKGIIDSAPDAVIYPKTSDEIQWIISLANENNVVIIPFGGGSNIAGCLESPLHSNRMIVSLDMKNMRKVLSIDTYSHTATVQPGVLGPDLEKQLNKAGFTSGHFPDSFEFSSLGGWVATRSAGMQSDVYGKIEDILLSVKMITPTGTLITRTVPKCSNGIDVKHLCLGSEGIFGVLTEIVIKVKPLPNHKKYAGYLFPNFESGIKAIYECVHQNCLPVMTRLNDPEKTALSFAFKTKSSYLKNIIGKLIKVYLRKIKKIDFAKSCLMLNAYEANTKSVFNAHKKQVEKIYKKFGAIFLGAEPGNAFFKAKYDFPYIRDYVMDYGFIADVSETATTWKNILPLYQATLDSIKNAIKATGSNPWAACHISHNYENGASLYFTFACLENKNLGIQQYLKIKKSAEDCFMHHGATCSHHHAVGYEHMPWIEEDISTVGVKALQSLKAGLDPNGIMNPDKIIPNKQALKHWQIIPLNKNIINEKFTETV